MIKVAPVSACSSTTIASTVARKGGRTLQTCSLFQMWMIVRVNRAMGKRLCSIPLLLRSRGLTRWSQCRGDVGPALVVGRHLSRQAAAKLRTQSSVCSKLLLCPLSCASPARVSPAARAVRLRQATWQGRSKQTVVAKERTTQRSARPAAQRTAPQPALQHVAQAR